ncbi:MAG: hypothetical protein JWM44_1298 [Bacilli bacterium]|nr:hypothetical protein [Bacilli bacterium]
MVNDLNRISRFLAPLFVILAALWERIRKCWFASPSDDKLVIGICLDPDFLIRILVDNLFRRNRVMDRRRIQQLSYRKKRSQARNSRKWMNKCKSANG